MTIHIDVRLLRYYKCVSRLLARLDTGDKPWAVSSPGSLGPRGDIIVFPGSFNPPTLAHLAMLRQARKFANRHGGHWQVYAAMSKQIVDKEAVERMTLLDRVVLLEHVLEKHVRQAGILLLNRGLYVEQAQGIRAAFPRVRRLYFLMGFDKIVQILDPRYYADRDAALRELFGLAQLLVAPRGDEGAGELKALLARAENRPFASFIHPLPLEPQYRAMSSTLARSGAQLNEVPPDARDFILRTRPYTQPDGTGRDIYAERTRELRALLAE